MTIAATRNGRTGLQRFFDRVAVGEGCWLWAGGLDRDGYGRVRFQSDITTELAHRWIFEAVNGPIADELEVDHLCHTRACVRLDHLEAVTRSVNCERRLPRDSKPDVRTHCGNGHEFTEQNTYEWRGERRCRACNATASAKYNPRRNGGQHMVSSRPRIVPASVAHSVSAAAPCSERLRFPGDEIDAQCRLTNGDHTVSEWHEDQTRTRRWRVLGRGKNAEGMVKPGSAPLRRLAVSGAA